MISWNVAMAMAVAILFGCFAAAVMFAVLWNEFGWRGPLGVLLLAALVVALAAGIRYASAPAPTPEVETQR